MKKASLSFFKEGKEEGKKQEKEEEEKKREGWERGRRQLIQIFQTLKSLWQNKIQQKTL